MRTYEQVLAAAIVVAAAGLGPFVTVADAQHHPGTSSGCADFRVGVSTIVGDLAPFDISDEGWVWVDPTRKIREVSGLVRGVGVADNDTPANHDSHDLDISVVVDPGQTDMLSVVNGDADGDGTADAIGLEWETGIDPDEDRTGEGAAFFPKWVWPSIGDRVWANGHWVFDCGHPNDDGPVNLYRSEIHPPRAVASMRQQAATLPGTGATPVPVTATDLYIHGRAGFVTEMLNCGMDIILGFFGHSCGTSSPPPDHTYKTTPIDDDYAFDVCLPVRPAGGIFSATVTNQPYNTLGIAPDLRLVPASAACQQGGFDPTDMLRVRVLLEGTGVAATEVYARRITAGWVVAPETPLPHRRLTINTMDLHDDHEPDPGDGELTMMWVNVNHAPTAWRRFSDFATGNMNDYDSDDDFGDGLMHFSGLAFDYYVPATETILRATGYEQDCYDNSGAFGFHFFTLVLYGVCHTSAGVALDPGGNDVVDRLGHVIAPGDVGDGDVPAYGGDYDLEFTVADVPLVLEDASDLGVSVTCTAPGEVPVVGVAVSCDSTLASYGPGLARAPRLDVAVTGVAATIGALTHQVSGSLSRPAAACGTPGGATASCDVLSVPVSSAAGVRTSVTPAAPGILTHAVTAVTSSSDGVAGNNHASASLEVFVPVTFGDAEVHVSVGSNGQTQLRVLSTDTFDATTIDPATVCFGDAANPADRACGEAHGRVHAIEANADGLADAMLHFETAATGIALGDTQACVRGRTTSGVGFFGCVAITAQ